MPHAPMWQYQGVDVGTNQIEARWSGLQKIDRLSVVSACLYHNRYHERLTKPAVEASAEAEC